MSVVEAVERAAKRHREQQEADEGPAKARARHPMPTKDETWRAWCNAANDAEELPDRAAFEAWWAGA